MKFSRRGLSFIFFISPTSSPLSNNLFLPSGVFSLTPLPTWIHGYWILLHPSDLNSLSENITLLPGLHTHPVPHLSLLQLQPPPPSQSCFRRDPEDALPICLFPDALLPLPYLEPLPRRLSQRYSHLLCYATGTQARSLLSLKLAFPLGRHSIKEARM